MKDAHNPFQISFSRNPKMDAYDLILQVGGLKDEKEAKQFADILAEWMAGENGWKQKVQ